ncbi:DNA polymerase nu-like [Aricia agestis]|uniref:DNA polymerase nu-like n=1 Tax=Aricia agestis TaxID=91739 RepID=UPI001C20B407|nr:DNA polymerase nu-like [Aricia agestis]
MQNLTRFNDFPSSISACEINRKKATYFSNASFNKIPDTSRVSTTEELLSPVVVSSSWDLAPATNISRYDVLESPKPTNRVFNNNLERKLSVGWNEFLDEDFFGNFDNSPRDIAVNEKDKNEVRADKDDITIIENYKDHTAIEVVTSSHVTCEPIPPPKSRKSTTKNNKTDKVKKVKNVRKCFRKDKYNKAVKNWLNDVESNVDKAITSSDVNYAREGINDKKNTKIDKHINKKVKKIVQARLANKGGIMKYSKPKMTDGTEDQNSNKKSSSPINNFKLPASEETCENFQEKPLQKEQQTMDKPKPKEDVKIKEKKARSKFVAPVLTPLPVKDVTYEIEILDQQQQGNTLFNSENTEILMVLIYGNGFNQLNCQYATTDAPPEGIVFGVGDQYYYIKNFTVFSEEAFCRVISSNILICFHAKDVLIFLMKHYDLASCSYNIIDLKVGGSLLSPDEPPDSFSKLQKLVGSSSQFSIASECPLQKCARYMALLRECGGIVRGMLKDAGMWTLFSDIEMQALPIIAEMEHHGICVNEDHLKKLDAILFAHMKEVEEKCYCAAGRSFQITSALQVRNIVYGELRLDEKCNVAVRETVTKAKSTSEAMLRLLAGVHPLPALVLQYRQLHKARTTFVAGILHHVRGGVVRPKWEQNAAVTGRIACNNPNLQAIPKTFSLTLDPEQEGDGVVGGASADAGTLSFRGAYVAHAGRVLLAADFRHAECRVLALAAADAALAAALASPDLFAELAAQWLGKSVEAVCSAERERTKRLVYACLYGAGARKMADILRMTEDRARDVIDSFHKSFSALRSFGEGVVAAARGGRLRTPGGRVRRLPHLTSDDRAERAHAERQAVNFIVQGSAADLCKSAMVSCGAALRGAGLAARPLLQIHDELVWELEPQDLPAAAKVIKSAMEGCGARVGLPAAFPVQLSAGPSWGDLRPYTV